MIYRADKIDMISIDGEVYESVSGLIELPIKPKFAKTHGLIPASREEIKDFEKAKKKLKKEDGKDGQ